MSHKIYLASSWRNAEQQNLVSVLRHAGHHVYDFKNPSHEQTGFSWKEIDGDWQNWTASQYRSALQTTTAVRGFEADFGAMRWADTCVLLLPCGRSAHLEAGFMAGEKKRVIIVTRDGEEPELMALLASKVCINWGELLRELEH